LNLAEIAAQIRLSTVETIARAGSGHYGGALSCIEILTAIYFRAMKPGDRFILSKGHAASALYATLAQAGILDPEELTRLNAGGILGEEPNNKIPGVEVNTGSLGHGLGLACGMALADKRSGSPARIFVLMGDGECWEGSVWEALMFGAHHHLNITLVIDQNGLAIGGKTSDIMSLGRLHSKLRAFDWPALDVNGHNVETVGHWVSSRAAGPFALIANTIKGKGISFMENDPAWHHGLMSPEQLEQARRELGTA
jgi:transketolase